MLALLSCSPQKKLNRLIAKQERLIDKYPDLVKARDTVFTFDTIIKEKPVVKFKPYRVIENKWDTIYKDKTKFIYKVGKDSAGGLTLEGEIQCPPDTVYKEGAIIERTVYKEVPKMNFFQKIFYWLGLLVALAFGLYFGGKLLLKQIKPF